MLRFSLIKIINIFIYMSPVNINYHLIRPYYNVIETFSFKIFYYYSISLYAMLFLIKKSSYISTIRGRRRNLKFI